MLHIGDVVLLYLEMIEIRPDQEYLGLSMGDSSVWLELIAIEGLLLIG